MFSGKQLCWSLFLINLQALSAGFLKKKNLIQVFTCEYCKIFKNIIFYRTTLMVAFDNSSCGNMIYRKSRRLNTTSSILAKLYLFKVNNKDIRMTSFNLFEEISHIALVFPLLTLNK